MSVVFLLLYLICLFTCMGVTIAGAWLSFSKAQRPGWAVLVPIYNTIVMLDIGGKPWWWLFLMMIPIAGIYFAIVAIIEFSKAFGMGVGFAIGLAFLPFVFFPLLGFGDAEYQG